MPSGVVPRISCSYLVWFLQNHINPALDFTQTPPGMLALDNMLYLAKVHQDTYIRVKAGAASHSWCPSMLSFPQPPSFSSACRLCWRTVAGRTNTSVHSAAVPLSSPRCSVRSCRLESSVSLHLSLLLCSQSPARDDRQLDVRGLQGLRQGSLVLDYSMSSPSILSVHGDHGCCFV